MRRKPVLLWGFGFHVKMGAGFRSQAPGTLALAAGGFKNAIARAADGYLAYTGRGAEALAAIGLSRDRIWVVRNTIDIAEHCLLHARLATAAGGKARRGPGPPPHPAPPL